MRKTVTTFLLLIFMSVIEGEYIYPNWISDSKPPKLIGFQWWGKGTPPAGAENAPKVSKQFIIHVDHSEIEDLKRRLARTRYSEPLEDAQFQYGFPGNELKKIVEYWANEYDWRAQENDLNKYNHFKVNIEGIDIHYMRITPRVPKNFKVLPLMLIHGWPGSFFEFIKIVPLLTTPNKYRDFVFDVIVPSIPGYGFSEAPHKQGFAMVPAARIFDKLMGSLKFETPNQQYYVQGGDWGGYIASAMAIFYPDRVRGLHLNLAIPDLSGRRFRKSLVLGKLNPALVTDKGQTNNLFPLLNYTTELIQETGYFHIQATKPDTVGSGLTDSPAGLAAYILEKFSTGTDLAFRDLPDGGLTRKFKLDDLLTNVMIYWISNTITSSIRFYKECVRPEYRSLLLNEIPITVPVGIANFPNDIITISKMVARDRFQNIITLNHHSQGGHFATLEVPQIFAEDIFQFVALNEKQLLLKDTTSKRPI